MHCYIKADVNLVFSSHLLKSVSITLSSTSSMSWMTLNFKETLLVNLQSKDSRTSLTELFWELNVAMCLYLPRSLQNCNKVGNQRESLNTNPISLWYSMGFSFQSNFELWSSYYYFKALECNLAKEASSQIKFAVSQRLAHFTLGKTIYIQLKSDP